jgi:hypothetical protein
VEEQLAEVVELFQKGSRDVSPTNPESMAKAVSDLARRMKELGFTPDQIPPKLIKAVILAVHRAEREKAATRPDQTKQPVERRTSRKP